MNETQHEVILSYVVIVNTLCVIRQHCTSFIYV